jgi:hypothetical protein
MPGGFVVLYDKSRLFIPLAICMVMVIAVHSALVARYVRRYGNVADIGNRSPQVVVPNPYDWLGPPRSSIAAAIGWKQMRESGPIALVGLLGIIGTAVYLYALEPARDVLGHNYAAASIYFGFGIALVAGIGVALHDCEPRLNTFWRSRPISADLWFAIKFVTGLAIVVGAIYIPLRLFGGQLPPYLWLRMPALHIALFAAAVAMTCIVRHAIYAAILSMGVLAACIAAAWLVRDVAGDFGCVTIKEPFYSPFETQAVVIAGAGVCFVVSTIAAWVAMRNDWGWKSRY